MDGWMPVDMSSLATCEMCDCSHWIVNTYMYICNSLSTQLPLSVVSYWGRGGGDVYVHACCVANW